MFCRPLIIGLALLANLTARCAEPEDVLVFSTIERFPDTLAGARVLEEAYRRLGIEIRIEELSGTEALRQSNAGLVDGEVGRIDGASKQFTNLVQVAIPISYMQGAVFSKDPDLHLVGWHSLRPYRVGRVEGVLFSEQGTRGMNTVVADDYEELIELLQQDKVDVVVAPYLNGQLAIQAYEGADDLQLNGVLESYLLYHYLHSKHRDLVPAVEKVLKAMVKDGTTTDILHEYVEELTGERGQ
jgi:ABC-type amino acid transport substrate-binding protein